MTVARESGNRMGDPEFARRWFPVTRSEEVIGRHVLQTQLLGQEIAVWRDDAGAVNAWENRCPHRGVRLSIGFNTGTELRCQYHGWRYATGSGQCTFIPAHPGQRPASTIRTNVFGAIEQYGFVWVHLGQPTPVPAPTLPTHTARHATTLRSIFVEASAATVAGALLLGYRFSVDPAGLHSSTGAASISDATMVAHDPFMLTATADAHEREAVVTFLLQPVTKSQTVMHGLLHAEGSGIDRLTVLRHQCSQMTALRDVVESTRRANSEKLAPTEHS
jgi:nitrite reductase/ring-hydroxylating ferredoxin subunit